MEYREMPANIGKKTSPDKGGASGGSGKTFGEQWAQDMSVGQRAAWIQDNEIMVPIHLKEKVLRGGLSPEGFISKLTMSENVVPKQSETPVSQSPQGDIRTENDFKPTIEKKRNVEKRKAVLKSSNAARRVWEDNSPRKIIPSERVKVMFNPEPVEIPIRSITPPPQK